MTPEAVAQLAIAVPLVGAVLIWMSRDHPNQRETVTLVTSVGLFALVATLLPKVMDGERPAAVLVETLPGLPLAIELAAARVRVMNPKALLERMAQRFRLLTSTGGRRDRQATLRGALDWSWDLLSEDEQATLIRLMEKVRKNAEAVAPPRSFGEDDEDQ